MKFLTHQPCYTNILEKGEWTLNKNWPQLLRMYYLSFIKCDLAVGMKSDIVGNILAVTEKNKTFLTRIGSFLFLNHNFMRLKGLELGKTDEKKLLQLRHDNEIIIKISLH
jgi:hypothetical protein